MKALLEDLPRMLIMCEDMHLESRYSQFSYDERKMSRLIQRLIGSSSGIALVKKNGMLLGAVDEYWFGPDRYAFQFLLYVEPGHRGGGDAIALIKEYTDAAKSLGAKDIHIENTTLIASDRTEKLFEKMGFSRIGGNFVMEV